MGKNYILYKFTRIFLNIIYCKLNINKNVTHVSNNCKNNNFLKKKDEILFL